MEIEKKEYRCLYEISNYLSSTPGKGIESDNTSLNSCSSNSLKKQRIVNLFEDKKIKKKGGWSKEEDNQLLDWVSRKGARKWTECSRNMKGRSGKQCRERWVNILDPSVKKGNWSEEEQKCIFESLIRNLSSWSQMAKSLPGRTENSIKNYFYSSVRRIKSVILSHFLEKQYSTDLSSKEEFSKMNLLSKLMFLSVVRPRENHREIRNFILSIIDDNRVLSEMNGSIESIQYEEKAGEFILPSFLSLKKSVNVYDKMPMTISMTSTPATPPFISFRKAFSTQEPFL